MCVDAGLNDRSSFAWQQNSDLAKFLAVNAVTPKLRDSTTP